MNIDAVHRYVLWCESTDRAPVDCQSGVMPPIETHPFACVRFPLYVQTEIFKRRASDGLYGASDRIGTSGATANPSLVFAIVQAGRYSLGDAIVIASEACGRCLNALAHAYGLSWGYEEGGPEWRQCRTECPMCQAEPTR
jgi:hypothetical protein